MCVLFESRWNTTRCTRSALCSCRTRSLSLRIRKRLDTYVAFVSFCLNGPEVGAVQVLNATRATTHTMQSLGLQLESEPTRTFVFCNFNHLYKTTPAIFDVWMRVLGAVPNSVLWLVRSFLRRA